MPLRLKLNYLQMKQFITTLLCIVLFSLCAKGQDVLLEEDVKADTIKQTVGPNLKHFTHLYFDLGFIVGESETEGADINYGKSYTFSIGYRYKRKICNFYAIGFDISYYFMSYNLKQNIFKILPNDSIHNKEKLIFNNLGLELYNRFNFGKRGNYIGNFIDIGAYGNWAYKIKHYTKDDINVDINKAKIKQVTYTGLVYPEELNYGLRARIGINRYVLSATYRLSDLFKEIYDYPELPRLSVGLQIGLHK